MRRLRFVGPGPAGRVEILAEVRTSAFVAPGLVAAPAAAVVACGFVATFGRSDGIRGPR